MVMHNIEKFRRYQLYMELYFLTWELLYLNFVVFFIYCTCAVTSHWLCMYGMLQISEFRPPLSRLVG